jgi:hypothetical protein
VNRDCRRTVITLQCRERTSDERPSSSWKRHPDDPLRSREVFNTAGAPRQLVELFVHFIVELHASAAVAMATM